MEIEELNNWKEGVCLHIDHLNTLINDRKILKNSMEEHLKSVFQWDDIEFNRDFTRIELTWEHGHNPVIKPENVAKLGMDWIIRADYDDKANRVVVIEIYPWGVKEGLQDPQ